jgi:hypothetical protein
MLDSQLELVFAAYRFLQAADPDTTGTVSVVTEGLAPSLRSVGIPAFAYNHGVYVGEHVFIEGTPATSAETGEPLFFVESCEIATGLYRYCFGVEIPEHYDTPTSAMQACMAGLRQWLLEQ